MAVNVRECEEMISAAQRANVKLMIAYRLHFEEANLEAINIAQNGTIGEPRFFTSEFAQQVDEANIRATQDVEHGGGPVYDMGVYCINAARYLFADDPVEVTAVAASRDEPRFRKAGEMVSVTMKFPGQRLATFTCGFGAADVSRYTMVGTKGTLMADPAYEYAKALRHELIVDQKRYVREFPKRDQFAAELVYFSNCVLNNKEPEPSGLEGLADVQVVQAIYQSVRLGKMIELPKLPPKRRPTIAQEIHRRAHDEPETVRVHPPSQDAA